MKTITIIRSRRGADTAPLLMVFCAICLALTALIVFPGISNFKETTDTGKAIKEMDRLKEAMRDMQGVSEEGAVEKMELDMPTPYCIRLDASGSTTKLVSDKSGAYSASKDYVCGRQTIVLIHEKDSIKVYKK
jgi:hypothetical protein